MNREEYINKVAWSVVFDAEDKAFRRYDLLLPRGDMDVSWADFRQEFFRTLEARVKEYAEHLGRHAPG